jgi:hypothetical protein
MLADPAALGDQFTTAPATGSSGKYNLYLKFGGSPDVDTVEVCGDCRRSTLFLESYFACSRQPKIQSEIDALFLPVGTVPRSGRHSLA